MGQHYPESLRAQVEVEITVAPSLLRAQFNVSDFQWVSVHFVESGPLLDGCVSSGVLYG
jgi:hypothetical protein